MSNSPFSEPNLKAKLNLSTTLWECSKFYTTFSHTRKCWLLRDSISFYWSRL